MRQITPAGREVLTLMNRGHARDGIAGLTGKHHLTIWGIQCTLRKLGYTAKARVGNRSRWVVTPQGAAVASQPWLR